MTEHQHPNLEPAATFLIEREPVEGYQVTSAQGRYAEQWKRRALDLLDTLGQPDPKGPSESQRLVGPVGPTGELVHVRVELLPNGEARYHQAWFQVPKAAFQPKRANRLLILVFCVGFLAGAAAFFLATGGKTLQGISGNGGPPHTGEGSSSAKGVQANPYSTKLQNELAASRELRENLIEYLSQEGFAADMSAPTANEKWSVRLDAIGDFSSASPPPEPLWLNNVEVAKLLNLLRTLDQWEAGAEALPESVAQ